MSEPNGDLSPAADADRAAVHDALDELLRSHNPSATPVRDFLGYRFDAGLAWVHFAPGAGGLGVAREWQAVVENRLLKAGAPPPPPCRNPIGIGMGAPTIAAHGSPEHRSRLLRPLYTGEEIWCQLFSEPGAGSDLAGLATRAVRSDDHWQINGQKVWTSYAHRARWAMLLARTDPDLPKHAGLTYFFLDMHAPGVDVRPLRQLTGGTEFNEVFLTDVVVPDDMRVGELGQGWSIATTTLMNERVAIGGGAAPRASEPVASLVRQWRDRPDLRDRVPLDEVTACWVRAEAARLANERIRQQILAGEPGPEGSASKLTFAAINQEATRLRMALSGEEALRYDDWSAEAPADYASRPAAFAYLRARANSIEGGTSEILRGVIADRILRLPREPRIDPQVPWKDIPR